MTPAADEPELSRLCTRCREELPRSAFGSNRNRPDGVANECLECARARTRAYRAANPGQSRRYYERNKEGARQYYAANRERIARYYEDNRLAVRAMRRDSRYGLGPGGWLALLERQEHRCYLCTEPLATDLSKAATDHDRLCCPALPACGKCVRGISHMMCNSIAGYAGDSPDLLIRIAANLRLAQDFRTTPPVKDCA